ncbi:hypothetical protein B0T26DRAFT_540826 [Lasiosphaeria miniovina]|uniref:Secreted protein n=1 Tax=Lasiosphaeria miniovina TaxID=1954250 RepID=A0AA40DG09_9PEZI|nr:uncharacterized protein B0T26DRAFT_540826 [Lasiosphaeria miniovina]KAK0702094.1 hypothetical protein B0T26DRAFT_540826 [Lasiosphaeria miniovina]
MMQFILCFLILLLPSISSSCSCTVLYYTVAVHCIALAKAARCLIRGSKFFLKVPGNKKGVNQQNSSSRKSRQHRCQHQHHQQRQKDIPLPSSLSCLWSRVKKKERRGRAKTSIRNKSKCVSVSVSVREFERVCMCWFCVYVCSVFVSVSLTTANRTNSNNHLPPDVKIKKNPPLTNIHLPFLSPQHAFF